MCRLFVFALNIVERLLTMITSYNLMYYDYSGVDMKFEIAFFLNQLGKSTHTICTISEI